MTSSRRCHALTMRKVFGAIPTSKKRTEHRDVSRSSWTHPLPQQGNRQRLRASSTPEQELQRTILRVANGETEEPRPAPRAGRVFDHQPEGDVLEGAAFCR